MIAGHAALLAWKAGRPVKMIYDRAEDMAATTKRHPSRTRHRTAVDARRAAGRDGHRLRRSTAARTARCRRSCCRAARSTRRVRTAARTCACAAARSRPTCRRTARSAASARRRASSRSSGTWTRSPRAVGLAPDEFRRRNFITSGRHAAPSARRSREPVDMARAARSRAGAVGLPRRSARRFARDEPGTRRVKKGMASRRSCTAPASPDRARSTWRRSSPSRRTPDGTRARARREHRDRPGHQHDLFADRRRGARASTATTSRSRSRTPRVVPDSGPTVASRTCMVVGKLVETAALGVKHALIDAGYLPASYTRAEFQTACRRYVEAFGPLRARASTSRRRG